MSNDIKSIIDEFHQVINMTAKEIESWLDTDDSKAVGQKDGEDESIGHQSGRQIVQLLQKKQNEYTDDDLSHMKKVISYVHRHSAQRPSGDIKDTRWRYSLKNWGHEPLK